MDSFLMAARVVVPMAMMMAVGVLLFVAVSFFNVVAIRKKVLSLF